MDSAFDYSCPATKQDFTGRENDRQALASLISQEKNIAMYCPPKTGRHSLIQQAVLDLRSSGTSVTPVIIDLKGIRSGSDFFSQMGEVVTKAFGLYAKDFPYDGDVRTMLRYPFTMAKDKTARTLIILDEFQKLDTVEESYQLFKDMEEVIKEYSQTDDIKHCSLILTGTEVNAMKEIFEKRKLFFRTVNIFHLSPFSDEEIVNHIRTGFSTSGKVMEDDLIMETCRLFKNNIWYIDQFMALCDYLSRGYIMRPILEHAMNMMISIHEPRFRTLTRDLTGFQIQYLKAVIDGQDRFSSMDVISRYGLSSSANVKRLREALMKKEIITFNENGVPEIMDPLLEYWIKKYFFYLCSPK